jgi:hypothetical protein
MSSVQDKIRAIMAKTVANGCTEAEAKAAFDMAVRLINKHGLAGDYEFASFTHAGFQSQPEGKSEKAKSKAKKPRKAKPAKPVKDDGKLRVIAIVTGTDKRGRKVWSAHSKVSHTDLKAALKALRERGIECKSKAVK